MNHGSCWPAPHLFSRDQRGVKTESESQPGKPLAVCSAGPGLHKVMLPSLPRVQKGAKRPDVHAHAPMLARTSYPTQRRRQEAIAPACPSSPPHPPVRSHRPWSSLKQIDAAEAEQKLSSSAASGIPDDPLRGMPCLPVRPWCRAPAPAGMALARPTNVRRRRRTFAFSMLPYVPD